MSLFSPGLVRRALDYKLEIYQLLIIDTVPCRRGIESLQEFSRSSFDEYSTVLSGRRPFDQDNRLSLKSVYRPLVYPYVPFIIIN